jgi:flagellar biosynthesis anti-sigma factor FlgM
MMISGVNNINQVNNLQNVRKTDNSAKVSSTSDSVTISKEAKEMAEIYYMDKVAAETPDVRADRVAEVKEKIKDPSYLNDVIFNSAADKFLSAIGL